MLSRILNNSVLMAGALLLATLLACSLSKKTSEPAANQPGTSPTQPSTAQNDRPKSNVEPGALKVGEASGSYTAKGETVELRYAYAGKGKRFNEDSIIILVTDKPIPAEALAEELQSQTMLGDGRVRGLEYVFMKDGFWVRFHPSQYQESKGGQLKEYTVDGGVVRGRDEDDSSLTDGKYSRSVRFAAALSN